MSTEEFHAGAHTVIEAVRGAGFLLTAKPEPALPDRHDVVA